MSLTHTVRQSRRQRGQPTAEGIGVPLAITLVWYVALPRLSLCSF
nr:hypothetical protein [Corynebacterium auriscanis]